jgi:hypothetical protein
LGLLALVTGCSQAKDEEMEEVGKIVLAEEDSLFQDEASK